MASPLATVFSLIDQMKRNLSPQGIKSTLDQTAFDLQQTQKQMEVSQGKGPEAAAAQKSVTEKMLNAVLNFAPGVIGAQILLHGGPSAVKAVDPTRLVQAVHGPGFYTTNKVFTPQTFATKGGKTSGEISVYNFPDELYANTLRVNSKPVAKQPALQEATSTLIDRYPDLRTTIIDNLRGWYKADKLDNPTASPDSALTAERLYGTINKYFGTDATVEQLQKLGIPGKTWQYSAERPAELATAVYPDYYSQLEFLGSVPTAPGEMKATTELIKQLIATAKGAKP